MINWTRTESEGIRGARSNIISEGPLIPHTLPASANMYIKMVPGSKSWTVLILVFSLVSKMLEPNLSLFTILICKDGHVRLAKISRLRIFMHLHIGSSVSKYDTISSLGRLKKLVTKHTKENEPDVIKVAEEFVSNVRVHITTNNLSPHQIINTDQIGLEKEIHSSRTLSFKGEKATFDTVASKNASTHSYTLHPSINMAGQVVGRIFLYL